MPKRVSDEQIILDFKEGFNSQTIAYFRKVKVEVVEQAIRNEFHGITKKGAL